MAYPDDPFDPYAPAPPVAPWSSWDDTPWAAMGTAPGPLQPGLGIPQAAMPAPPSDEIEMPVDDLRPNIGFPRVPEADPGYIEMPVDDLRASAPPELPPMPDAISGGDATPVAPGGEVAFPDPTGTQLTDEQRAAQFAAMSPEDRILTERSWLQQRDQETERRLAPDRLADEQQRVQNEAGIRKLRDQHRARMIEIDEQGQKLAAMQVDPEKWWNDRSTGQKIAGFLAAIVGGLVQGRVGGPNSGLAMIENAIERDIDAQKANMAHQRAELQRRGASLEQLAAFDEKQHADAEQFRVAAWTRVQNDVARDMQQWDPRGKTAIENGRIYADMNAKRQEAARAAADAGFKRGLDLLKAQNDAAKTAAEIAKLEAETAKLRGAAGGGGTKPENVVYAPEYYAQRGLVPPDVPMSEKQYRAWQGLKKGSQDITANQSATGLSKEERENMVPGVFMADGKTPFVAIGRPEDVSKLRNQVAAARRMISRMDDALRTRTGWSSDVGNSDERKKLQVQWGNVKNDAKELFDLGAITASDVPLIEGSIGTDDPSSWKDPTAGILEARRLLAERVNSKLHAAGWDESLRFEQSAPSTKRPEKSADDRALEKLQNRDVGSYTTYIRDTEDDVRPDQREKRTRDQKETGYQESAGIPPGLRKQIDAWGVAARASGPDGKPTPSAAKARAYLTNLTDTGGNDAVRAAAAQALTEANTPTVEQQPSFSAQGARDSIAEPPKKKPSKKGGK